jgi:hypothetical protein
MNSKYFWYGMMAGSIALFWAAMLLGTRLFGNDPFMSRIFFLGLLAVHALEIPLVSLKIGKEKQIPIGMIILKTLLYGFTWWLPLKKGLIER